MTRYRTLAYNPSYSTGLLRCGYLEESLLVFGDGGLHAVPKSGLSRYGPLSLSPRRRHPEAVRVGIIGTAEMVDKVHAWLTRMAAGVDGDKGHPEFPGYMKDRGFFSELRFDSGWTETITQSELKQVTSIRMQRERFEGAVSLLQLKLRLLAEKDFAPQYVVVGLDDDLVRRCGVADYQDPVLGRVHRDLRRAIKAEAMKFRMPTQLLRQHTLDGRDRDHPSKIAWNYFTGLYFKSGGIPWGPHGLTPGTCYIGVSFYRPSGKLPSIQTSLVQAFDENGDGLVLRGHPFEWDPRTNGSRSPHLQAQQAYDLISMILARYRHEMHQYPKRVVVYKTSRYWPNERDGFDAALQEIVQRYDLVSLQPQSEVRLITESLSLPRFRGHLRLGKV